MRSVNLVLVFIALASALALVYVRHETRRDFVVLMQAEDERRSLQAEWSRLKLEHSTHADPARIEQEAAALLDLSLPEPNQISVVVP